MTGLEIVLSFLLLSETVCFVYIVSNLNDKINTLEDERDVVDANIALSSDELYLFNEKYFSEPYDKQKHDFEESANFDPVEK